MRELNKGRALVVLSGGQDSTTCLGWALEHYPEVEAVTFDYAQRHSAELAAAAGVRSYLSQKTGKNIPWETVALPRGIFAGDSPLTNEARELETYTDHESMEKIIGDRVELTFVPMRNALFLTLAANRAVVQGCGTIVTGVCQGDNANYPDCRQEFIWAQERAINEALGLNRKDSVKITIKTPLMNLSKSETVNFARTLPHTYEALAFSHTAYDGSFPPTGNDHASVLRAHGFETADQPDPLILRAHYSFDHSLPTTPNYRPELVEPMIARLSPDWEL